MFPQDDVNISVSQQKFLQPMQLFKIKNSLFQFYLC